MTKSNWKDKLVNALDGDELLGLNIEGTIFFLYNLDDGLERLTKTFDDDYGSSLGESFWAWSSNFVFFCCVAEGHEWIGKVPRYVSVGQPAHFGEE